MKSLETDGSGELFWNGKKVKRGLSLIEIATISVPVATIVSAVIIVLLG
jgi:hypothetical protein